MTAHRDFAVVAPDATEAIEAAKEQARAKHLRIVTLGRVRKADDGSWVVTLVVRS